LKIFAIFTRFCQVVEKASIDEAYLDLTIPVHQKWEKLKNSETYFLSSGWRSSCIMSNKKRNPEEEKLLPETEHD
jgi:nucleotidyltransferase/DNA polymerase involved in DNA repair